MFRNLLSRTNALAEVKLQRDEWSLHSGETVDFRLEVYPKKRFFVRGGYVELVCREKTGGCVPIETVCTDHSFSVDMDFLEGVPYRKNLELSVPPYISPTVLGNLYQVDWSVRVQLDIAKRRKNIVHEQAVIVSRLAPPEAPNIPLIADVSYKQCDMSLLLEATQVRIGDQLGGTLRLLPRQMLRLKEVWVELLCREEVLFTSNDSVSAKDLVYQATPLYFRKAPRIERDEVQEWNFELHIPSHATPSAATDDVHITWYVRGVMTKLGRIAYMGQGMFDVKQEIEVYRR